MWSTVYFIDHQNYGHCRVQILKNDQRKAVFKSYLGLYYILCWRLSCNIGYSWRNPEAAFYWDPVSAALVRHYCTSSVMSQVTSPRALTPPLSQSSLVATWRTDAKTSDQVLVVLCTWIRINSISMRILWLLNLINFMLNFYPSMPP